MKMVTNLTPQAKAKWAEATAARNPATKLKLLREFYSLMPHHKGTKKLEMSIKRQISSLEEEIEKARLRKTGSSRLEWIVKKEGFIQLALVSSLQTAIQFFNHVTGSRVTPYEVLHAPTVGVVEAASIQLQMVLTPFDKVIGEEKQERFMNLARNADGIVFLLGYEPLSYIREAVEWFEEHNIDVRSDQPPVEVKAMSAGGVRVVGGSAKIRSQDLMEFLKSYEIGNAVVRVSSEATLDDVESAIFGRVMKKNVFITLNEKRRVELLELVGDALTFQRDDGLEGLVLMLLKKLGYIRVYTKSIGGARAEKPLIVKKGVKAGEIAEQIHKELAASFQYAKIWREGLPSAMRVGRSFLLEDGDVIEIHAS